MLLLLLLRHLRVVGVALRRIGCEGLRDLRGLRLGWRRGLCGDAVARERAIRRRLGRDGRRRGFLLLLLLLLLRVRERPFRRDRTLLERADLVTAPVGSSRILA